MNADLKTAAARRVKNGRRQHGNLAPLPEQPAPPPAQAEPRAARPATLRPPRAGDAGRTLFLTPTDRSFGEERTVHILYQGRAMCGLPVTPLLPPPRPLERAPLLWQEGSWPEHYGVPMTEHYKTNCNRCFDAWARFYDDDEG